MRALVIATAVLAGIILTDYGFRNATSITVMGWIAFGCVAMAITLMTAVALDPTGQVCDLIREMMAVASIVMSLLTPLGLSDGLLFTKVDMEAAEASISIPVPLDEPLTVIDEKGTGQIVLIIKEK